MNKKGEINSQITAHIWVQLRGNDITKQALLLAAKCYSDFVLSLWIVTIIVCSAAD